MKNRMSARIARSLATLALLTLTFASCKKDNQSPNNPNNPSSSNVVRIQQGTDPDLTNDTVYMITYTDTNHIASIIDSVNQDTLTVTTTANGSPLTVHETYGYSATYTYDDNGSLQQLDYIMAGSHEQDVFEYTGGTVSKRTHNSNLGSGPVSLQGSFTYTTTNGNITDIKEYDLHGNLVQETTCNYNTQTNDLKNLGLLNLGNILGAETFLNIETWFNKNLVTGYTTTAGAVTTAYTLNSASQPTTVVSTDNVNNYLFTWNFSYK